MSSERALNNDRPDPEGNNEATTSGQAPTGEQPAQGAPAVQGKAGDGDRDAAEEVKAQGGTIPMATIGEKFRAWFNLKVAATANPTIRLGTKTAKVVELDEDGDLVIHLEGEGGQPEEQWVAFEAEHLDMLLKKFAVASV